MKALQRRVEVRRGGLAQRVGDVVPSDADRISTVRAPLLLTFAALDCWCRLLQVPSKTRTDGHDVRSAAPYATNRGNATTPTSLASAAATAKAYARTLPSHASSAAAAYLCAPRRLVSSDRSTSWPRRRRDSSPLIDPRRGRAVAHLHGIFASRPRRRRDSSLRTIHVGAAPSPVSYSRRGRGVAATRLCADYPRRGSAGAYLHGISTSRPRRRRDPSPRTIHVARRRRRRDSSKEDPPSESTARRRRG